MKLLLKKPRPDLIDCSPDSGVEATTSESAPSVCTPVVLSLLLSQPRSSPATKTALRESDGETPQDACSNLAIRQNEHRLTTSLIVVSFFLKSIDCSIYPKKKDCLSACSISSCIYLFRIIVTRIHYAFDVSIACSGLSL